MQIIKPCEIMSDYQDEHFPHSNRELFLYSQDKMGVKCFGGPDPVRPDRAANAQYEAFIKYGPQAANVFRDTYLPLSGDITKANLDLYNKYGAAQNKVGQDIAFSNASRQAKFDRDQSAQGGAGAQAVQNALGLDRQVNQEYYAGREGLSSLLQALNGQVQGIPEQASLSEEGSGMSGGELAELERNLSRYQGGRGNLPGSGGSSTALENALAFGEVGHNRLLFNRNENRQARAFKPQMLMGASGANAQALQTMRSPIDAYKIATGKSSMPDYGNTGFASQGLNQVLGIGQQTFGQYGQFANNYQTAPRGSTLDDVLKGTQAFSNIAGGAGGAAMCWIAREVYGPTNIRWTLFRDGYMLTDRCSDEFRAFYLKYGEKIVSFIKDKPSIKEAVRKWMDSKIAHLI